MVSFLFSQWKQEVYRAPVYAGAKYNQHYSNKFTEINLVSWKIEFHLSRCYRGGTAFMQSCKHHSYHMTSMNTTETPNSVRLSVIGF